MKSEIGESSASIDDEVMCLDVITFNPEAFKDTTKRLQLSDDFILKAAHAHGGILKHLLPEKIYLRENRSVVETAVNSYGPALQWASEALQADKEIVITAVGRDGLALEWASKTLQADRDVVLQAVSNDEAACEFVDCNLMNDGGFVEQLIKINVDSFEFAPEELRCNKQFVLCAVEINCDVFQHIEKEFLDDREFLLAAIAKTPRVGFYLDKSWLKDKEFVLAAVKINPRIIHYVDTELKKDAEVLEIVLYAYIFDLRKALGDAAWNLLFIQHPHLASLWGFAMLHRMSFEFFCRNFDKDPNSQPFHYFRKLLNMKFGRVAVKDDGVADVEYSMLHMLLITLISRGQMVKAIYILERCKESGWGLPDNICSECNIDRKLQLAKLSLIDMYIRCHRNQTLLSFLEKEGGKQWLDKQEGWRMCHAALFLALKHKKCETAVKLFGILKSNGVDMVSKSDETILEFMKVLNESSLFEEYQNCYKEIFLKLLEATLTEEVQKEFNAVTFSNIIAVWDHRFCSKMPLMPGSYKFTNKHISIVRKLYDDIKFFLDNLNAYKDESLAKWYYLPLIPSLKNFLESLDDFLETYNISLYLYEDVPESEIIKVVNDISKALFSGDLNFYKVFNGAIAPGTRVGKRALGNTSDEVCEAPSEVKRRCA